MTIQEKYDEFFGTGYWEKQYKDQICIFAKQVLEQRAETADAADTIVRRTWWAVYLYGSPEPTRLFKSEDQARHWGDARDNKCVIDTCTVEAKKYA